jgi:hypothetical protein
MSDEIVLLSAENADDMLSEFTSTYPFSEVPGRPREGFRVKSAPIQTINRWQKAAGNKNKEAVFSATCQLIADSVIDQHGAAVWGYSDIARMAKSNTMRFMDLQLGVLQHNGLTRKQDEVLEQLIDDESKN